MNPDILTIHHVTKTYPGVVALNDVSLSFRKGEVHAFVGENGAGKSTLIKLISGAIRPDSGRIEIDGTFYSEMTPSLSRKLGIEVIYQEFNLIPNLSVAENIFMGNYPGNGVTVNYKKMRARTLEVFKRMKIHIDPDKLVRDLSVAYMQMVEIAKALSRDVRFLIMDEPTAPLTIDEVTILLDLIKQLKENGVTVIYVSHRLGEIDQIADRVSVFRDGELIGTKDIDKIDHKQMVRMMVGRDIDDESFPARRHELGEVVLSVKNLSGNGIENVSFDVHKGEIFGLAGLVGAGRTETVRALFGCDRCSGGEVYLNGQKVSIFSPRDAVRHGIGFVPEDRKQQGVILPLSIRDNIMLPILRRISKLLVVSRTKETAVIQKYRDALRIKTPSFEQKVMNLSGGNQQKVVLSKWLASESRILILDEPTRGIDVGAKQEIYELIRELTEEGISIIMISSEMKEILGMSDRIMVLCEGRQAGVLERSDFSQERVLELASGDL